MEVKGGVNEKRHKKDREKQREIIKKRRKTGMQRVCKKRERKRMKKGYR
jgi:hypothetical protein